MKVATTSLQTRVPGTISRVHHAPVLAPDVAGGGSDRAAPWLLWHSVKHQVLLRTAERRLPHRRGAQGLPLALTVSHAWLATRVRGDME